MWIESHQSLRSHPKIKKAARIACINEFEMIGRLHCLWWWALDYAPDGDLTNYTDDDIEDAVDWSGERGLFVTALTDCGFNGNGGLIDVTRESRVIHDWHEYGGRLLEKRQANKERMREKRAMHVHSTTIARTGATEQNNTEQHNTDDCADKPRKPVKPKTERATDELFDAIAKVTCTDPATAGASIGKIKAALVKANPPYTASEVLKFGADWPSWKDKPPTLWQLKEQIGIVRNGNGNGHHDDSAESIKGYTVYR